MFGFNLFKSSNQEQESNNNNNPTWNPDTLAMEQPTSPAAPSSNQVVSQQPPAQEQMEMRLRGGGSGDVCCGICAGIACFECCEICC